MLLQELIVSISFFTSTSSIFSNITKRSLNGKNNLEWVKKENSLQTLKLLISVSKTDTRHNH